MRGVPLANAPRVRRVRAADQGPLDWLVPFIPPVLRVNRETRAEIRRKVAHLLSKEALESVALALRPHWRSLVFYSLITAIWIGGLVYIHHNEPEFAVAYVILSGFAVLGYHLLVGGEGRAGGMSAYSVFNRGTQRMLGSLSAEQFEVRDGLDVGMPHTEVDPVCVVFRMRFAIDSQDTKMLRTHDKLARQLRTLMATMKCTMKTTRTLLLEGNYTR